MSPPVLVSGPFWRLEWVPITYTKQQRHNVLAIIPQYNKMNFIMYAKCIWSTVSRYIFYITKVLPNHGHGISAHCTHTCSLKLISTPCWRAVSRQFSPCPTSALQLAWRVSPSQTSSPCRSCSKTCPQPGTWRRRTRGAPTQWWSGCGRETKGHGWGMVVCWCTSLCQAPRSLRLKRQIRVMESPCRDLVSGAQSPSPNQWTGLTTVENRYCSKHTQGHISFQ